MVIIDITSLPGKIQQQVKQALDRGDTVILAEDGTAVAEITRPSGTSRGIQIGHGNIQQNHF